MKRQAEGFENSHEGTAALAARIARQEFVDKRRRFPGADILVVAARPLVHIAVVEHKEQEQSLAVAIGNRVSLLEMADMAFHFLSAVLSRLEQLREVLRTDLRTPQNQPPMEDGKPEGYSDSILDWPALLRQQSSALGTDAGFLPRELEYLCRNWHQCVAAVAAVAAGS